MSTEQQIIEQGLLQDIRANPKADLPRLAFADFLNERIQGSDADRAEFIRAQLALEHGYEQEKDTPLSPEQRSRLERREEELLKAHREEWLGKLPPNIKPNAFTFVGGFPYAIELTPDQFENGGAELIKRYPITQLRLTNISYDFLFEDGETDVTYTRHVFANPALTHITALEIAGYGIGPQIVQILADSPHLSNLTTLDLPDKDIGVEEARALAKSKYLTKLTSLNLYLNNLGPEGTRALAESPNLANLVSLNLSENGICVEGARTLAGSPYLSKLNELYLWNNRIGSPGAQALAESPHLANLIYLNLESNSIGVAGARALAGSPHLSKLTGLDISKNRIGTEGARALVESPHLTKLTNLNLESNRINPQGSVEIHQRFKKEKPHATIYLRADAITSGAVAREALVAEPW